MRSLGIIPQRAGGCQYRLWTLVGNVLWTKVLQRTNGPTEQSTAQ